MANMGKILVLPESKNIKPYFVEVKKNFDILLQTLKEIVDGYIEFIPTDSNIGCYKLSVCCSETGFLEGKKVNYYFKQFTGEKHYGNIICYFLNSETDNPALYNQNFSLENALIDLEKILKNDTLNLKITKKDFINITD